MALNFRPIEKGAGDSPRPTPCAPGDEPGKAGAAAPPAAAPATPVTTERRTPETRIQPGDHVRDMSEGQRTGIVDVITKIEMRDRRGWASFASWATVQWSDGGSEELLWGFLERIPAAVAA